MLRCCAPAALVAATLCFVPACGSTAGDDSSDASPADAAITDAATASDGARPDADLGAPITAPDRTWTFIPFPDSSCDDGTPTGIGVSLVAGAPGVLIYLNGGGECYDYNTCFVLNTAARGPFGAAQFAQVSSGGFVQSLFDRNLSGSPFAAWSHIFVPYCTGDLHTGERDTTYTMGANSRVYHHRGRSNLVAYLRRIAASFPAGTRVALAGSSAGGYGAVYSHDLFRQSFPTGRFYVIDDSGPLLAGDGIPAAQRTAWYANWGLGWLDALCATCRSDMSQLHSALATRYPADRTALISSVRDQTIASYLMLTPANLEAAVRALAATLSALPERRAFLLPGNSHTTLGNPGTLTAGDGFSLMGWLGQQLLDDTGWVSHTQ
ncbi:MAG: esterase [Deltaproteobacteria bacterium]|nr:esterase [Deltaproteobacteria bacterium]